jgi:hypothetical protein
MEEVEETNGAGLEEHPHADECRAFFAALQ